MNYPDYPTALTPESSPSTTSSTPNRTDVATVTINRPDSAQRHRLPDPQRDGRAFEDASYDDQIGVLVLTGAGDRAFCTGADLASRSNS